MDTMPTCVVEARARMLIKAVFFSYLLYDKANLVVMKAGETHWCGVPCLTAMTDGRNIVVNLDFFNSLRNVDERAFVLAHEIYHLMVMHPKRMRRYAMEGLHGMAFLPDLFNIAADIVINKCLIESKIGRRPVEGVFVDKIGTYTITGMETAEEIYLLLIRQLPPGMQKMLATLGNGDAGLKVIGQAGKDMVPGSDGPMANDIIPDSPDKDAANINEAEMKVALSTAMLQAKAQGTLPAGLKRMIDEFLEHQVPWQEILRLTVVSKMGKEQANWSRPNKRLLVSPGVYAPKRRGLKAGAMAMFVDTSGSVSAKELAQFMGEIASILGDVKPETSYLGWCDAQVDDFNELADPEEFRTAQKVVARGGGGTSFIPPFKYLDDNDIDVDTVIYFTDGYGPFPNIDQVGNREMIWCISTEVVAPVGTTVKVTF